MNREHINYHDELNSAFASGAIFDASQDDLKRYLQCLGTVGIMSAEVRTKAVVRALTINHIQMAATINKLEYTITKLNRENSRVSCRVLILTLVCAVGTAIRGVIAYMTFFSSQ